MNISRGKVPCAQRVLIYGPEGIGKTTLASQFPDPLFIDTEGSTNHIDVARFDPPTSWQMLLSQVQYVIDNPHICKTLVIDTADWAEKLEIEDLCHRKGWDGLEGAGYGKGYQYSAEEFGKLLNKLNEVINKGVNVVMTAYAQLRKVELPEEIGAYDHWELKTSKKVAPMIKEFMDAVLFLTYKVNVINVDNQGAAKGKNKAQGGYRVIHTNHTPFWDAKNRYGMPDELPLEYASIAPLFADQQAHAAAPTAAPVPNKPPKSVQPAGSSNAVPTAETNTKVKEAESPAVASGGQVSPPGFEDMRRTEKTPFADDQPQYEEPDPRIPKALRDLMIADKIDEWEIQNIASAKGYMTSDTRVADYPKDFLEGWCIGYWPQLKAAIMTMREKMEVAFQ